MLYGLTEESCSKSWEHKELALNKSALAVMCQSYCSLTITPKMAWRLKSK